MKLKGKVSDRSPFVSKNDLVPFFSTKWVYWNGRNQ